jgi:hypothetical protein
MLRPRTIQERETDMHTALHSLGVLFVGGLNMATSGCNPKSGVDGVAQGDAPASALALQSSAFAHNSDIPSKYTCEGQDISPALRWTGAPDRTKTWALIMDDPDAPDPAAPKMTWVHWVMYDIPASTSDLPEAVRQLPAGTREGVNGWKRTGYGGPCPPIGRHRYFFKLYALDTQLYHARLQSARSSGDQLAEERAEHASWS